MHKITDKEENEMYQIINDALFALCHDKPNNPIEFLSKKMLELIGENTEIFVNKKSGKSKVIVEDVLIDSGDIAIESLKKNFYDNYKVIKRLGMGSYGEVHLAEEKHQPHRKVVVKIITKSEDNSNTLSENYLKLMLNIDHPNIVKIHDIIEDRRYIYVVQEYCEGHDLLGFIIKHNITSENLVKVIIRQILDGVNYLHKNQIVHRNIKPENILLSNKEFTSEDDIVIKLNDLSFSEFLGSKKKSEGKILGSPLYIAPEVIEGKFDFKCDLWSVGILTYLLLCGNPPYEGKDYQILYKIVNSEFEFTSSHSESARDFIYSLTIKNPKKRANVDYAQNHPWLSESPEENKKMEQAGLSILSKMNKFVMGQNLRRSVLSYVLSRKIYGQTNNQLLKLFKEIDKDGNGRIEVHELFEAYGRFFKGTPEEAYEQVQRFVENVDINKNGYLDYSEFLAINSLVNKEMSQKMLLEVFEYFDKDGNGYLQANDLKEIFEDTDISDENFQNMIDEFDQDGDRKISFKEFFEMVTKMDI